MGQAQIIECIASFVAGIMLVATIGWLIGGKAMKAVVMNALIGGIFLVILSLLQILVISPATCLITAMLGIGGVVIILFLP